MRKFISTTIAGIMLGTSLAAVAPAAAEPRHDRYIEDYYRNHDRDRDYHRWNRERSRWDRGEYRRWYRDHHRRDNNNPAAAIFGFAAGALAAGIAGSVGDGHVARCEDRYRSYDRQRDAYFGYDGQWHRCRL